MSIIKSISIIIPVFNNLEYTKQCLKRLGQSLDGIDKLDVQIVIIDDGSTDGTSEWILKNYPEHIILYGTGLLWWSGGINMGMKYAFEELNSEYIVWWNNDIIHFDDYFENLSDILQDNSPKTVLGSKIFCGEDKNTVWSMGGNFSPKTGKRYMTGFMEVDKPEYSKPHQVDWLPGMGTIFHRSLVEEVGYVDEENFPQYHGDSDYTLRAKKAGFTIVVDPRLRIWNDIANSGQLHGESFKGLIKSFSSIKSKYNLKKDILFFKRHAKGGGAYRFLAWEYFRYVAGFFKWKVLSAFSIRKKS